MADSKGPQAATESEATKSITEARLPTLKKWDRLEIFWEDSYQMHGWVHLDEAGTDDDISLGHQSIGYFVGETDKQVTIVQSKKSSKLLDDAPETNVNAVFSIPKKAILKIKKL